MKKVLFASIFLLFALSACNFPGQAIYQSTTNCAMLAECLQMHNAVSNQFNFLVFSKTNMIIPPVNNNFFANLKLKETQCSSYLTACDKAVEDYKTLIRQFDLGYVSCAPPAVALVECKSNTDCDAINKTNQACVNNVCTKTFCGDKSVQQLNNDGINEECESSENCTAIGKTNYLCVGCKCVAECHDGKIQSPEECEIDTDCTLGKKCDNCKCVQCSDAIPCPQGQNCVNNVCNTVITTAVCGNGVKEGTEQCDDGNILSGDGCSSTCQVELSGMVCVYDGNICPATWRIVTNTYTSSYITPNGVKVDYPTCSNDVINGAGCNSHNLYDQYFQCKKNNFYVYQCGADFRYYSKQFVNCLSAYGTSGCPATMNTCTSADLININNKDVSCTSACKTSSVYYPCNLQTPRYPDTTK